MTVRAARREDIPAIYELIRLYSQQGILLPRTEQDLRGIIDDFWVISPVAAPTEPGRRQGSRGSGHNGGAARRSAGTREPGVALTVAALGALGNGGEGGVAQATVAAGPLTILQESTGGRVAGGEADGSPCPVLACGVLHLYTPKIAEVRSLAVAPQHRGGGLGRLLVEAMLEEARQRRLEMVFAFTYATEFFARLGFVPIDRAQLPWKVWTDCMRCPKRLCCDEIAVAHRF